MDAADHDADAVRRALIQAAIAAYEDAGLQGLCAEGRWEVAVDAMRRLELGGGVARDARADDADDSLAPDR